MNVGDDLVRCGVLSGPEDVLPLSNALNLDLNPPAHASRLSAVALKRPCDTSSRESGPKRSKNNLESSRDDRVRVRCPFFVKDPEADCIVSSCWITGFAEMGKLKDHLKKPHSISEDMLKQLNFKSKRFQDLGNIEAKWKLVFHILFPEVPEDDTPSGGIQNTSSASRACTEMPDASHTATALQRKTNFHDFYKTFENRLLGSASGIDLALHAPRLVNDLRAKFYEAGRDCNMAGAIDPAEPSVRLKSDLLDLAISLDGPSFDFDIRQAPNMAPKPDDPCDGATPIKSSDVETIEMHGLPSFANYSITNRSLIDDAMDNKLAFQEPPDLSISPTLTDSSTFDEYTCDWDLFDYSKFLEHDYGQVQVKLENSAKDSSCNLNASVGDLKSLSSAPASRWDSQWSDSSQGWPIVDENVALVKVNWEGITEHIL